MTDCMELLEKYLKNPEEGLYADSNPIRTIKELVDKMETYIELYYDERCSDKYKKLLKLLNARIRVDLPNGVDLYIGGVSSYRGSFDNLQLTINEDKNDRDLNFNDLYILLKGSINSYFVGYKGGVCKMYEDTNLWISRFSKWDHLVIKNVSFEYDDPSHHNCEFVLDAEFDYEDE